MAMINYIKLSTIPDADKMVDCIANTSKGNFVKLEGTNSIEALNCLIEFMVTYKVWSKDDQIKKVKKPVNFRATNLHDISFILEFYNMACRSRESKMSKTSGQPPGNLSTTQMVDTSNNLAAPKEEPKMNNNSAISNINKNLSVLQLANKNIDHFKKIRMPDDDQIVVHNLTDELDNTRQSEMNSQDIEIPSDTVLDADPLNMQDLDPDAIEMPLYSKRGKKISDSKQAKMEKLLNEETENYNMIKIVKRGTTSVTPSSTPLRSPKKINRKPSKNLQINISQKSPKKQVKQIKQFNQSSSDHRKTKNKATIKATNKSTNKTTNKTTNKVANPKKISKEESDVSDNESFEQSDEQSDEQTDDKSESESYNDADSGDTGDSESEDATSSDVSDDESVDISPVSLKVELKKNTKRKMSPSKNNSKTGSKGKTNKPNKNTRSGNARDGNARDGNARGGRAGHVKSKSSVPNPRTKTKTNPKKSVNKSTHKSASKPKSRSRSNKI